MSNYFVYADKKSKANVNPMGYFDADQIIEKGRLGEIGGEYILVINGWFERNDMKASDLPGFPKGVPMKIPESQTPPRLPEEKVEAQKPLIEPKLITETEAYLIAKNEISTGQTDQALWLKAFAHSNGERISIQAKYTFFRAEVLLVEYRRQLAEYKRQRLRRLFIELMIGLTLVIFGIGLILIGGVLSLVVWANPFSEAHVIFALFSCIFYISGINRIWAFAKRRSKIKAAWIAFYRSLAKRP